MIVDIEAIARHYGGKVTGGQAMIPAIGHSGRDRGVAIKAEPSAPDGCLVHCFNGGDELAEKDRLRADGFLAEFEPKPKTAIGPWKPVAVFEYANADGEVIYRTVRREPESWSGPGKRPKEFRAEHYERGKWRAGMGGCKRVPYRLPELLRAIGAGNPVCLVEGEAKADRLAEMNIAATAVAFGANGWRSDYAEHFHGARVVILPDNDEPGRDFARQAFADLSKSAEPSIVELPGLPKGGDILDWPGTVEELVTLAENPLAPDWLDQSAPKTRPESTFQFVAVGDLKYRAPEFLIDGLLETETLCLLFGDPGCGKSFLAVDIALSVASGASFHGRETKQGAVFLVAGEGHNGLARRFAAWSQAKGVSLQGIPLFKSERAAQLLDGESAQAVANAVHELAKWHGVPALIIIDTLARNFGPGDENSTSDMSNFVAAVDDLKAQFPGSAILIVHHSGHAEKGRARGAMALKGALDIEYRVEKKGAELQLSNTKMKDAEPPADLFFIFRQVCLGGDVTSAVLESAEPPERCARLSPPQELAKSTYIAAAVEGGRWSDTGFSGLHRDVWREAFYSKHTGDSDDTKRKAFNRARNDLTAKGLLEVESDIYRWQDEAVILAIVMQRDSGTGQDMSGTCPEAEVGKSGTDRTNA